MTTSTAPVVSTVTRTPSNGPSPLFSTNIAMPGADRLAGRARRFSERACSASQPIRGQRLVEQPRVVAGIVDDVGAERVERARVRHLCLGNEIAAAHLDRIDAEPAAMASISRSRTNVLS